MGVRLRLTSTRFERTSGLLPPRKFRRGAEQRKADDAALIKRQADEIYHLKNDSILKAAAADVSEAARRVGVAEEISRIQVKGERLRTRQAVAAGEEAVCDAKAAAVVAEATAAATIKRQAAEISKLNIRVEMLRGTVGRQMDKVESTRLAATLKLGKQLASAEADAAARVCSVTAQLDVAEADAAARVCSVTAQLDAARDLIATMRLDMSALEADNFDLEELGDAITAEMDEMTAEMKASTRVDGRTRVPQTYLGALQAETGLPPKQLSAPARAEPADQESVPHWRRLSITHMAGVIEGRGEGEAINNVADALHRCGYLERLPEARRFQHVAKAIAASAVAKVQEHWTARHSVHIWDRLELSRSQMESLYHLLSFVYDPATDKYVPIRVWENPNDSSDFVVTAKLVSRVRREAEFSMIAETMNITVSADGRCERDAIECTSLLYSNFSKALRQAYTLDRPAQPVLYLDGTGGALGRGICHGEIGCADFIAVGDSDAKQSRATLQPLFLYQGNDHAEPLRANLDLAITSYNKLVRQGCFNRSVGGVTESIPARAMTAADMQGAKTTYGMRECSHSVWCKCQRGGVNAGHKAYPTGEPVTRYEEILEICNEMGCDVKTFDDMCSWAHFSPGVAKGGAFTSFTCSCCDYSPSEVEWRADLAVWHAMSDEDQAAAQAAHMDKGDAMNSFRQHYHQVLYMPPMPHHGMERCGVDNLHLIYLNVFKHLFKYTIHEGLPPSKKALISDYCKKAGFYSYDAASVDEDPTSHWIGREVKRFLSTAHIHIPFLLQIAAAPADCVPEMADLANDAGEQQMEFDPEYAPTDAEVEQEEKEEPLMMKNAARWDNFLNLVRASQAPWPQGEPDTDDYRKGRAVEAFNLGGLCANDILELKPEHLTWVLHILVFIVPRQMVLLGDPTRRSCDACESFGAMAKKVIKHATCRRCVMGTEQTEHGKKAADGSSRRWKQTFNVGFIEQAFRRVSVRESLQHGEVNAPYRLRVDARRTSAGKATKCTKFTEGTPQPMRSVHSLVTEIVEAAKHATPT